MNADRVNSFLHNKRVLVTGARGFIGSRLCQALQTYDVELHGVSRKKQIDASIGVRWWIGDLSEMSRVKDILGDIQPDIIFHLASHVVGSRALENIIPTFASNLQSTVNLLTAATEIGCRKLVLVGSQEEPAADNVKTIPSSPYAAAKWSASAYARMFHALYGTPVSIARLFMVYGPGQLDLTKLIPYVTLSILRGEPPKLTSGTRPIDWIYVDDVVEGLIAVAGSDNTGGGTFDIGSGTLMSIKDTIIKLVQIVGQGVDPMFGTVSDRAMEQIRKADIQATYKKIGWQPTTSLEDGLHKTVQWYSAMLKEGKAQ